MMRGACGVAAVIGVRAFIPLVYAEHVCGCKGVDDAATSQYVSLYETHYTQINACRPDHGMP